MVLCRVPLTAVYCRDVYEDGHEDTWLLLDTRQVRNPSDSRRDYALRRAIEEMRRQVKCFWDMTAFTSPSFSLVVNQVIFVLPAYTLIQVYVGHREDPQLNRSLFPIA